MSQMDLISFTFEMFLIDYTEFTYSLFLWTESIFTLIICDYLKKHKKSTI